MLHFRSSDKETNGSQFIFKETEFEAQNFQAANFVTKYRKVCSLESLKEQLLQYSNEVKQQLYDIINRDYKDFITISTKLDGVDTRTVLLKKPLTDLRTDVNGLHEGVVTSMEAIQEKVKYRLQIAHRRHLLEMFLSVMQQLNTTQCIIESCGIHSNDGTQQTDLSSKLNCSQSHSRRSRLLKAMECKLQLQQHQQRHEKQETQQLMASSNYSQSGSSNASTSHTSVTADRVYADLLLERDTLVCSEFERASHCLSETKRQLNGIYSILEDKSGRFPPTTVTGLSLHNFSDNQPAAAMNSLTSLPAVSQCYETLDKRRSELEEGLSRRVVSHMTYLLTDALLQQAPVSHEVHLRSRSFAHCVRALICLGRGATAEKLLADSIITPFISSLLTQGRVDGKGGRGSYSGLEEAFEAILEALCPTSSRSSSPSLLTHFLRVAETTTSSTTRSTSSTSQEGEQVAVDLITCGIWKPLADLLQARFADMFSIGIPATLSLCYRAHSSVLARLAGAAGPEHTAAVTARLKTHALVMGFFKRWKLDLYFQLRCKETFARIDTAATMALRSTATATGGASVECKDTAGSTPQSITFPSSSLSQSHNRTHMMGSVYAPSSPVSPIANAAADQLREDLSRLELHESKPSTQPPQQSQLFQDSFFTIAAIELQLCLHPTVFLDPLAGKVFSLILRTVLRIEAQVALSCGAFTPSFPTKTELDQLRELHSPRSNTSGHSNPAGGGGGGGGGGSSDATTTPGRNGSTSRTLRSASPATPAANAAAAAGSTVAGESAPGVLPLSVDELTWVCDDLLRMEKWLLGPYTELAEASLLPFLAPDTRGVVICADDGAKNQADLTGGSVVLKALKLQVDKLSGARNEVWSKVTQLLVAECKRALTAVKAVAGKYRMTNKPPPDSASPYVTNILAPLR